TSRLMCEGEAAALRASPRLAEEVTAMIAMLAQGNGHFKREEAEVVWIIPLAAGARTIRMCSFDGRSGGQSRPPPWSAEGKRSSVDARHSIHVHLVNQAHARTGENLQPTTSLPCGS